MAQMADPGSNLAVSGSIMRLCSKYNPYLMVISSEVDSDATTVHLLSSESETE